MTGRRTQLFQQIFVILLLVIGLVLLHSKVMCAQQDAPDSSIIANEIGTENLLQDESLWQSGHKAVIAFTDQGLRVEIAPGQTWGDANIPVAILPKHMSGANVSVTDKSSDSRWFSRIYGKIGRSGESTNLRVFQHIQQSEAVTTAIDPRLFDVSQNPLVQIQLGLEGQPGDYVVFDSLIFRTNKNQRSSESIPGQINIECVELMPNMPEPYDMRDWRTLAHDYDAYVFDFDAKGEYLPLIWLDESRVNIDRTTFGLSSYVGDGRTVGSRQEGITCLGAVLGATLVGIDKSRQRHNYVAMCEAFYNRKNGQDLVLNGVSQGTGGSFWYEIWPSILYCALADCYPEQDGMDTIVRKSADRWLEAYEAMGGRDNAVDFDHTAFSFTAMEPRDNGRWREPDAAAGIGWLEYSAWKQYQDPRYLQAAEGCIRFLDQREANPYYEVLLPWGALTAARMNAELGHDYDVEKMVDWCFGISRCRGGWGVIATRWGNYDCHGLVGSIDNHGGYGFAMNTFAQSGALVPLVRYDTRFARAIGKWMLNAANASRLYYPDALPSGHESSDFWHADSQHLIAYEGLRAIERGKTPVATGDPVVMNWGPKTDRGLYGSSYVGFFGGIVNHTNIRGILQIDCLRTDFYRDPAYPTYLYYNAHDDIKRVTFTVGDSSKDLYDAVTNRFIASKVTGKAVIEIPADRAIVLTVCPADSRIELRDGKKWCGGVVIDYAP